MHSWYQKLLCFLGVGGETISTAEMLAATAGGFVSIFCIGYISFQFTGASGAALIVPSMGATAVLLFAVPHGRLSQPWPLFAGHLISACIGVTIYQAIPGPILAAGLAVGLAIGAMHVLGCMHPPGGAAALAAVLGGPAIHELGYGFVIAPVLLNTTIIFLIAIVFNSFFPWRRYPASLMRFTNVPDSDEIKSSPLIDKKAIEQAIGDMDLYVDITIDDLQRLFALTMEYTGKQQMTPEMIRLGNYYTNGSHGADWSVRQIIDESCSPETDKDMVIYRVVEGQGMRRADSCTRQEFARWAQREVFPSNKESPGS